MSRNISAVCPPDPRTITILADDFRDGGGCCLNAGRIHRSRIIDTAVTADRMESASVRTDCIDISDLEVMGRSV